MNKRLLLTSALVFMLSSVSGCVTAFSSSSKSVSNETSGDLSAQKVVKDELLESARQIESRLITLAKLSQQDAVARHKMYAQPHPDKSELNQKHHEMVFSGLLEQVVETIAHDYKWGWRIAGRPPLQPIIVHVESTKKNPKTAFKILEDCGWEAGRYVHVDVNENERFIEIVYLPRGDQ